MRGLVIALGVSLLSLAGVAPAWAQDLKLVKKIENANRLALEDFDLGDSAAAKKALLESLETIKTAKLDRHAVAVTTHLDLGVVYAVGLSAEEPAVTEFRAALEIDPAAVVPAKLLQPAAQKAFDRAKTPVETKKPESKPEVVVGIVHVPVDSAAEGNDITIEAKVGADVKAKKVTVSYRAAGAKDFVPTEMKNVEGVVYRTVIPAAATATSSLQYYLEARNEKGKIAAARGSVAAPFAITIQRAPKEKDENEGVDDEDPLKKLKK